MAAAGLAFNRKGRFFTGKVLPMPVPGHEIAHLGRFLGLCGREPLDVLGGGPLRVQLLTEYSLVKSLPGADPARFRDPPKAKETRASSSSSTGRGPCSC